MRVKKNERVRRDMCRRLTSLIDTIYGNDAEVARIMGYANPSPLYRVRQLRAFPDVERLEKLLKIAPAPRVTINLNWIVAGKGEPVHSQHASLRSLPIAEHTRRSSAESLRRFIVGPSATRRVARNKGFPYLALPPGRCASRHARGERRKVSRDGPTSRR